MKKLNVLYAALLLITATNPSEINGMEIAPQDTPKKERLKLNLVPIVSEYTPLKNISLLVQKSGFFIPEELLRDCYSRQINDIVMKAYKTNETLTHLEMIECHISHNLTESALKELYLKNLPKKPIHPLLHTPDQDASFKLFDEIIRFAAVPIPIEYLRGKKPNDVIMFLGKATSQSAHGSTFAPWVSEKSLYSMKEDDPDFLETPYTEFVATQEFCEAVNKLMISTQNQYCVGNLLISGKPLMDTK